MDVEEEIDCSEEDTFETEEEEIEYWNNYFLQEVRNGTISANQIISGFDNLPLWLEELSCRK